MKGYPSCCLALLALAWLFPSDPAGAAEVEIGPLIEAIRSVGPEGKNHRSASEAVQRLARAEAEQIPAILAGFEDENPLASNWLRSAVETIAQRRLDAGGRLPASELEAFVQDRSHAPRARRLAFELLVRIDPQAGQRLIPGFLDDPSLELRRDAVAAALARADGLLANSRSEAATAYREALSAARDADQVDRAAAKLRELGQPVDLTQHFGFITTWKLIAPFDHGNMRGFDVGYGPEVNLDPTAEYPGKEGVVRWVEHATADPYGTVDLNQALGRMKGSIAYAYAEFFASQPRDVELRLGCINGNKVWLNGELLTANNVYHAGSYMDQYVGRGRLKAGKNTILLKIAQNEQTESWAQRWQFQLRVCDQYGTAVLSGTQ
ncbi:MAG: hypothetical protein KJ000_07060 [Pirellulaceae bacterium]|nr:hypothetical protein [Pirellulaceae bacterium]